VNPVGQPGYTFRELWRLLHRSFVLAYKHNCLGVAKGVAYSALLSFLPAMTVMTTILVQIQAAPVSQILFKALHQVAPPGTEHLVYEHFRATGRRPATLLFGAAVISLWAASGVIKSLMEGFRAAYDIQAPRSFVLHQGVSILLVVAAAIPGVGASALVLFGARVEQHMLSAIGVIPAGAELKGWVLVAGRTLRYGLALGTVMLVTATIYYVAPNRRQRWRFVFPGAIVSTALWLGATAGFSWYVRHIADYNVLYGSIGAAIALLVWMYVQSLAALIGCEFNAACEARLSPSPRVPILEI